MRKHISLLMILFLAWPLASGCWNRREMNELAIVGAMGIDKAGDQKVVTTQIIDPGQVAAKQSKTVQTPVMTYQEKGNTIFQAVRRMSTETARELYFSHLRVLVIGEELAREGIGEILDVFSRDQEVRPDFFIVVAKDAKAENVLKVLTGLEDIPANKLFSSLETSEKMWAPSMTVTLDKLISDTASDGVQPHLTGLLMTGSMRKGENQANVQEISQDVRLKYNGIAVFKDDKLISWMNESNSKAVNYVLGNVRGTVEEVPCSAGKRKIALEVIRMKSNMGVKVANGLPRGTVQVHVEANIGEVQCKVKLMKSKTIEDVETRANEQLKKNIEEAIKTVQEQYKIDIFGFGEALHRSNPVYWKKVKNNWDEKFATMPVHIKTDVQIRRVGTIGKSPMEKLD
ncbi:Ger(x)C family spore germination protein [Bacillus sonorensis]|uniref:Ger(X)C family germination protein n=2 Tax=Bacillus sonorensis TaxID=119858 RepID=M5P8R0_9BACI|nr:MULTISPECIES: Ger(x)C family spore germination protein [Bacillus]TWK84437.1 Spore germination protein B3 [Bacillus paralicheniformis]ASB88956.1 Spore germination protein KC [Bacillus sonorensis]EME75819.1 Ger(x)C family germination protein [Bacillus sonorensis L12]MBG9914931.1 spore gernimation protein GerC [Bacillus sonorensis]MCF7618306.1 Ger(x)C family spore germination protein [Bacillus sonorensis]